MKSDFAVTAHSRFDRRPGFPCEFVSQHAHGLIKEWIGNIDSDGSSAGVARAAQQGRRSAAPGCIRWYRASRLSTAAPFRWRFGNEPVNVGLFDAKSLCLSAPNSPIRPRLQHREKLFDRDNLRRPVRLVEVPALPVTM